MTGVEAPVLPDYVDKKGRFIRQRNKEKKKNASSLIELIVPEVKTKYGTPFLIHDNKKRNRILVFASPIGLKMLSESKRWHCSGTFHTKSKYFRQLYTMHAYFPPSKYDEKVEKVWVKRMLPCVWIFQKRRRAKDYIRIFEALKAAARMNEIHLSPEVMIDFEIAAKIAFESVFDVEVIG